MFHARFFNGPELDTGPSFAALGLYLSGSGAAMLISSTFIGMIPTGATQVIAGWGCLFGFSFMMTGFALSLIGLAMTGFSAVKNELFNNESYRDSAQPNY